MNDNVASNIVNEKNPDSTSESKTVPATTIPTERSDKESKEKKPAQKTSPEIPRKQEAFTPEINESPIQQIPSPQPDPIKSAKPKVTPTLNGLLSSSNNVKVEKEPEPVPAGPNETVAVSKLLEVWSEFATMRKNQAAEYQILNRDLRFEHPVVMITLTNPVEESLLDNFKRDLIQHLRDKLKNSDLTIATSMQETTGKKVIYTSKEKFEHLAGKNPKLWDLKDRLGLDWDI